MQAAVHNHTITTDTHQQRPDLLVLLQLFLAAVFFRSMPTLLVLHYLIQAIDFPLHDTTRRNTTQDDATQGEVPH